MEKINDLGETREMCLDTLPRLSLEDLSRWIRLKRDSAVSEEWQFVETLASIGHGFPVSALGVIFVLTLSDLEAEMSRRWRRDRLERLIESCNKTP